MTSPRSTRFRSSTGLHRNVRVLRHLLVAVAVLAMVGVAPSANAATTYTQLAGGDGYTCGLTKAGRIACKGSNRYGQTNVPGGRYRAVDAGPFSLTCALTQARHARCWGHGPSGEKKVPAAGNFVKIAAGNGLACAMTSAGKVRCWGARGKSTTAPGTTFTRIASGNTHTCGLTRTGNAVCWGSRRAFLF